MTLEQAVALGNRGNKSEAKRQRSPIRQLERGKNRCTALPLDWEEAWERHVFNSGLTEKDAIALAIASFLQIRVSTEE